MNAPFYWLCRYALRCFFFIWNRLVVSGRDCVPQRGEGLIIAANHRSALDPPLVAASVRRRLTFLAKAELFKKNTLFVLLIRLLGAIPITSESEFKSIRIVIRALKEGKAILMFPEGTRSPKGEMLEPKTGVAFLARRAQVPVLPCYIDGADTALQSGKKGIKRSKIRVSFGKPYRIDASAKDAHGIKIGDDFHANEIMSRIERLKRF